MHGGYWNLGRGFGMFSEYYWLFLLAKGVFWIGLIYLAYRLIKNADSKKENQSLEQLKMRFVNGEITEEEYLHKRDLLN